MRTNGISDFDQEEELFDASWPTNEAQEMSGVEELQMQMQAAASDIKEAIKDIEYLVERDRYYDERIERATLEHILTLLNTAKRTLV